MTSKYLKSAERSKKAPTLAAWDLPFADEDRAAFASSALRQRHSPERRPSRSRLLTRTWGICNNNNNNNNNNNESVEKKIEKKGTIEKRKFD